MEILQCGKISHIQLDFFSNIYYLAKCPLWDRVKKWFFLALPFFIESCFFRSISQFTSTFFIFKYFSFESHVPFFLNIQYQHRSFVFGTRTLILRYASFVTHIRHFILYTSDEHEPIVLGPSLLICFLHFFLFVTALCITDTRNYFHQKYAFCSQISYILIEP